MISRCGYILMSSALRAIIVHCCMSISLEIPKPPRVIGRPSMSSFASIGTSRVARMISFRTSSNWVSKVGGMVRVRSRWTIFDVMHSLAISMNDWRCNCLARTRVFKIFVAF